MKSEFVDCFLLIGTALSLKNQEDSETGYPLVQDVITTFVNVSVTLHEIHFISTDSMEVDVSLLLHQRWIDEMLGDNIRTRKMAVAGQIWRPRITVTKGSKTCCAETEDTQFWRGFGREGNVLLSEKIMVKLYCTRNFRRFPFDIQICELKFGTYRFPVEEVKLTWDAHPAEILTGTYLNEFEITDVSTFHEVDVRPSGNFSVLVMQIVVQRYFIHYIICTMVPCLMLVLLAYASLWIDCRSVILRIACSLAAVLVLIYFCTEVICLTGATDFLKTLDVFVLLCLMFASCSLFENCAISYLLSDTHLQHFGKDMGGGESCSKALLWLEQGIKVAFPILYIFCLLMLFCYML